MSRIARLPRNSVKDRPARLKLLLRRQRWLLRPAAWAAFGLVAVVLVAFLVHSKGPGSTLATGRERFGNATAVMGLRVQNIVIEGRANTPEPLLRAAIGVTTGQPILGFSVADARARIETLSWVEHATVERKLPSTITVNLVERRPFAIWQNLGKFVLIDRSGQIVADQDVAQFSKLPLVVGPGAPAGAAVLIDALADRPALQAHVVAAVRIGERRWNLRLDSGTDVLLPEGAEAAAIERLMALQKDHALIDRPLQVVDMRLPDRLVVRPMPEPHAPDGAAPNAPHGAPLPTTKKPT